MKTLMSYMGILAMILMSSFTINTQKSLNDRNAEGCFNSFRIHRQAKNVAATWTINAPGITHFTVERSYDGEFFEDAETIICNGSSTYKYKDLNVFPGVIYYRITAVKSDGSTECSPVESIRIVQRG